MTAHTGPAGQPEQLDLFSGAGADGPAPAPALPSTRLTSGGSPARVVQIMRDVQLGRVGVLDTTERVVEFHGDTQVRLSPDEDVVLALLEQHYITEQADRYRVTRRHGAIARPVTPLRLTPDGKRLLLRWAAYVPLGR